MKVNKRPNISVEMLEQREVPASVHFDGANLYVYNPVIVTGASNVSVAQQANGSFEVKDNGQDNGFYMVTGNIYVSGNNAADTVVVTADSVGGGLAGGVTVTTGNRSSTVTVDSTTAVTSIGGPINISEGKGGGAVNIGAAVGVNTNSNVNVRAAGGSANSVTFGNATNASAFNGNVNVSNIGTATLGGGTVATTFGGNVTVQDSNVTGVTSITLSDLSLIKGSLIATGGLGATDKVTVNGSVLGNLTVDLSGSANSLVFGDGTAPITIGGNLSYTGDNGTNNFTAFAGQSATVDGNVSLNWGNGANVMGNSTGFVVFGNMNINDGNGGFDGTTNPFKTAVFGNLSINAGNGANSFTVAGNSTGQVGGQFIYNGGNGGNSITLFNSSGNLLNIDFLLGNSGANVFTIAPAAVSGSITGFVDFGPPSSSNPPGVGTINGFVDNGYVWSSAITLINIPS